MTGSTMVVDGNNLLMRAKFAADRRAGDDHRQRDNYTGSCLHLFINSLARIVRTYQPCSLTFCWDGFSAFRRTIYSNYKIGRHDSEAPSVTGLFQHARDFVTLIGAMDYYSDDHEADDLIAHIVLQSCWPSQDLLVVSGDKDLLQLVSDRCHQVKIGDSDEVWTPERVEAKYGCKPADLSKLMALTGDRVDGVPGVSGIGPKKALTLLREADWQFHWVAECLGPGRISEALTSFDLVDLRQPDSRAGLPTLPLGLWDHTWTYSDPDLPVWCSQFGLEKIGAEIASGTLWEPRSKPRANEVSLDFDTLV